MSYRVPNPLLEVKAALGRAHIIPEIITEDFTPTVLFDVCYGIGGNIRIGQEIDVDGVLDEPGLTLARIDGAGEAMKAGGTYTVAIVDPDARPLAGETNRLFRHWLVREPPWRFHGRI